MGASETGAPDGALPARFPAVQLPGPRAFHLPSSVLGIPVLYAWIFLAWAVLIALAAWVVEKRE